VIGKHNEGEEDLCMAKHRKLMTKYPPLAFTTYVVKS
jgi:hypothetical protein